MREVRIVTDEELWKRTQGNGVMAGIIFAIAAYIYHFDDKYGEHPNLFLLGLGLSVVLCAIVGYRLPRLMMIVALLGLLAAIAS